MFAQIISNTPTWVWVLLAGLVVLGYSQTKDRQVSFKRLVILPIVMFALSANSMAQTFGLASLAFLMWLGVMSIMSKRFAAVFKVPQDAYDHQHDCFKVRGSWVPMLAILTIFIGKYVVAIMAHAAPQLAQQTSFGIGCALFFGSLNAYFLARSLAYIGLRQTAAINKPLATA